MSSFFKLSGGGNDFLALVEPEELPTTDQIRGWCARRHALGADGLFVLERLPQGARMRHFNADGGEAELCLNGTRCAARLALYLGWAADEVLIETAFGSILAHQPSATEIALSLSRPEASPDHRRLHIRNTDLEGWWLVVGVPHFVIWWQKSLTTAPVEELGALIRSHPVFGPAGTNVDFVRFPTSHHLEIRSFERGVEAETLACGTGVIAAAATGLHLGSLDLPVEALTQGGYRFQVLADAENQLRWRLAGDARIVARGELTPEAELGVAEPSWT